MTRFVTTVKRQQIARTMKTLKGESETVEIDFSVWQANIGQTITGVTWEVLSGTASISAQTLSSNVASALITTPDEDASLIKVTAETARDDITEWIKIRTYDFEYTNDYGVCC